jgi:glucose-1-phosphate adenylyltransferase
MTMKNVVTFVLGGGRGTRLYPLTKYRSKPAVPVAGKYRLIDIPLSNCINSGLNRMYVLTQFNSVSLHRHIRLTYRFDPFSNGFVELLAAQQTLDESDWYQGTADAVRKNLRYLQQPGIDYVLVLSGDQLYRMDFAAMIQRHIASGAQVSIAALPVPRSAVGGLGIMRVDQSGRVCGFLEKPQTDQEVELVRSDPRWIDAQGIASRGRDCLASMGIYLFNRQMLVDVLTKTDYKDFGREIFPAAMRTYHVQAYLFDGYWEDIGTIGSFYEANLQLAAQQPPFELIDEDRPIYSRARFLPPSRISGARITDSLVADGCVIEPGAVIENSVIGLRCRIGRDAVIRNSILMGSDDYETADELARNAAQGLPPIGIGPRAVIEGAIVDKNCRIGHDVRIVNERGLQDDEREIDDTTIRDGILVVARAATLPDGWRRE